MNPRDGRRGRAGRRPASFPRRARRAPARNGNTVGRTAPIGALVISRDGKSKFYPEGGRDRPVGPRRAARDPSPIPRKMDKDDGRDYGSKRPYGAQTVYYNNSFTEKPDYNAYDMSMPGPFDDDDDDISEKAPPLSPQQTTMRSLLIFCCVAVGVIIVVTLAIIFPIAYVGSTSNGPTVTGTLRLDTPFVAAYDTPGSTEYNNIANDFTTVMDGIFQASSTYSGIFRETKVTDLTSFASVSPTQTQVSFSLVFTSGTELTPLFRNDVFEFVHTEISRAQSPFAALDVVTGTLSITESCNKFCANNGILSVLDCTCTCSASFTGDTCQNAV